MKPSATTYRSDPNRTRYQHDYYTRNLHRRKYTYVKKGVTKQLTPTQYAVIQIMRQGYLLYRYVDRYRYFQKGIYHEVNKRSVECLLTSKHLVYDQATSVVRLTEKGFDYKRTPKKEKTL